MKVTAIALGELEAENIIRSLLEDTDVIKAFPRIHITMCTEGGEAGMYFTNMNSQEVVYLSEAVKLEALGLFDYDEEEE